MKDRGKTKEQLIGELDELRKRLSEIEAIETERKQGMESDYKNIVETMNDGLVTITPEGVLVDINSCFTRITGWTKQDLVGTEVPYKFWVKEDIPRIMATLGDLQTRDKAVEAFEQPLQKKDCDIVWTTVNSAIVYDHEGKQRLFFGIFRDITERKQLEEERRKAERLESIGTLAGGIAHDFNNFLTGILGNINLAQRHTEPGSQVADRLAEAERASLRARDLTQQLLTFARGGAPVLKTASITDVIRDSSAFILSGSNVKCEYDLPDDLWPVEIDEGQMSQVMQNLAINADEAMPGGGTVSITVENTELKAREQFPLPRGKYVQIMIEDHGTSISKEHLAKIFDPYFTTKQKGSGLGLATAYSIVKNHDGHITASSELGTGTIFHIYLPASKKRIPKKKQEVVQPSLLGKGRVLVMDDEESIRKLLREGLTGIGYEVVLTKDGAEAIERYAQAMESGHPFDAVIMDLTIPGGMGGKEAINKLLEVDPNARVIVSSGYATDPIMSDYREYGFSGVVTKPYRIVELEKTLSSIFK